MQDFYNRLSYSFGNEDWNTEHQALRIQPNDRILCVTASGDRPLHLLLTPCREIVSVDINNIQNYLLKLKIAAMEELEYEEYLQFLGAIDSNSRQSLFTKVAPRLDSESYEYWLNHLSLINRRVLYQGYIEKLVNKFSKVLRIFRRRKTSRLFACQTLEEQRQYLYDEWDTLAWRKFFEWALNPALSKLFFRDPGLYEHIPENLNIGSYLYDRMIDNLSRYLAKENFFMSLIFLGKVNSEAFPPYLTLEGKNLIKHRTRCFDIIHSDIKSYLKGQPDNSFDCYSLSDIPSYMSQQDFTELLQEIYRTAKPGARFCFRQFLSSHHLPENASHFFKRDTALELKLEKEDRCFLYRFLVGTVTKSALRASDHSLARATYGSKLEPVFAS